MQVLQARVAGRALAKVIGLNPEYAKQLLRFSVDVAAGEVTKLNVVIYVPSDFPGKLQAEIDSPSPPEPDRRELLARCARGLRAMLPIFDILEKDPSTARDLAEKGISPRDFEAFIAEVEEASK